MLLLLLSEVYPDIKSMIRGQAKIVALREMLKLSRQGTVHSGDDALIGCLLYTSPSPRDQRGSRMPSSA